jgi:hypothetical protein
MNQEETSMSAADDALAVMIRNLEAKTGKTLAEWVGVAKKSGATKHGEIVKHLKENGLTHGYANFVAHSALESASIHADAEDLLQTQYAGPKAALRPLYETLIQKVASFGSDVEVAPKKGYVSLRRKKQFGLIQPSTATRLDVGISLKGVAPSGRLEASGSFNQMVSHRVRLESVEDIDQELIAWLRDAYDKA